MSTIHTIRSDNSNIRWSQRLRILPKCAKREFAPSSKRLYSCNLSMAENDRNPRPSMDNNGIINLKGGAVADEELEEFKDAFRIFDTDQNGRIDAEELGTVLKKLNFKFSDDQINQMVNAVDDNGDGVIDIDEFIAIMKSRKSKGKKVKQKTYKDELKAAFKVFDIDGNGLISSSELSGIMTNLGENLSEDDIDFMIGLIDDNHDGEIDFNEFEKLMMQGPVMVGT